MRERILKKVEECMKIAEAYYGRSIPRPNKIHFKSNGSVGGWSNFSTKEMMFHLAFAEQNEHEYFNVIIPHEVAHWVADCVLGYDITPKGKARHHGPRWKSVMVRVFNLPPTRCHNMSIDTIKTRVVRNWEYKCECRIHSLNTYKHNKSERFLKKNGRSFWSCRGCKTKLRFTGNEVVAKSSNDVKLEQLRQQLKNL